MAKAAGWEKCVWLTAVAVLGLRGTLGCSRTPTSPSDAVSALTADEVLQRMVATYAQARTYTDRGVVRLRYKQGDQWVQDEAKLAVKLVRPNKLALRAYQLQLTCDGRRLGARIQDQQTRDLDGQMLLRAAPEQLRLDGLYADPVVLNVIASGLGGPPVTLELLLADEPLTDVLQSSAQRELLSPAELNGRTCRRVQATIDVGRIVFWVDSETFLLRRLEYPTGALAEQLAREMPCRDLSLTADFRDAAIDGLVDEAAFAWDLPAQAKTVRRFVLPPPPPPTELLGRVPAMFHFTDLEGRQVTSDAWRNRLCVLAWFNDHPASQTCLQELNTLRRQFSDEALAIVAVCTEPTTMSNEAVQRLGQQWGVGYPLVRDLDAVGRDLFRIPSTPTIVVFDGRGAVQLVEAGADPALAGDLERQLRRLLNREDLAAENLDRVAQERRDYDTALAAAAAEVEREARAESNRGRRR